MSTFTRMILYVKDVSKSLAFYKAAFGFEASMIDPSGGYAELATGQTNLALSSEGLGRMLLGDGFVPNGGKAAGVLVGVIVDDVAAAYKTALAAGATPAAAPRTVPWGMQLAHVRDVDGILIEIGRHL